MYIGDNQTLDMLLDIATRIFEFYLHALFTGSLLVDFCISALVNCINGKKLPFNLLPGFKKYTIKTLLSRNIEKIRRMKNLKRINHKYKNTLKHKNNALIFEPLDNRNRIVCVDFIKLE